LIDSRLDLVAAVRTAMTAIGQPCPEPDTVLRNIGRPLIDFPALLGSDVSPADRAEFVRRYRAYYAAHCGDNTRPYPGVRTGLARMARTGLKLAVVTTKSQEQAELVLRTIGLEGHFDYVHGWLEGRRFKPDPQPLLDTLEKLDVLPGSALMVGDTALDLLAARAAGVDAAACLYGYGDAAELRRLAPRLLAARFSQVVRLATTA
jgi:phosphoglycolate phosphatase-like HAD superfamily hydrolase